MNIAERAAAYKAEYMAQFHRPPPGPFIVYRDEWLDFVAEKIEGMGRPELLEAARHNPGAISIQGMRILVI